MESFWEIFTLLTGILYIILEIRQHNFMWVVGVLTALAAMYVFFQQSLFASFGLNCYYLVVSFIGLWQWHKDSDALTVSTGSTSMSAEGTKAADEKSQIHLRTLTLGVIIGSSAVFVLMTLGLGWMANKLGDPMSHLDVAVAVLSAIATWWLSRSYKEQWLLWIVADALTTWLCVSQHLWWMTALYSAYTISAIYGYWHWKKHGQAIE